jgi:hypothetical protein
LQKRCPQDKNIAEFANYLPDEAKSQMLEGRDQDEEASEYDSEEENEVEEISEESPDEEDSEPEEEE